MSNVQNVESITKLRQIRNDEYIQKYIHGNLNNLSLLTKFNFLVKYVVIINNVFKLLYLI